MGNPKLRFTKNDGANYPDWASSTMGSFYTERDERGCDNLPVLTVSIHSGVSDGELDEKELGKRVKRSSDMSLYKKALSGDLVFNMMRAWQGAIGCVKTTGAVSPAYIVAKPSEEIYPPFMDYYAKSKVIIDRINRLSYGALDFRKRLYWDSFVNVEVNLPCLEEQQEIASFLSNIDIVIAANEEEIANLEKQKTAVMKKIFSQKVRFKKADGSDFSEWDHTTLGRVASLYQPATISASDFVSNGLFPVFGANGYIGMYDHKNHDTDQVCVSCRGAKCGAVNYVIAPVWITGNSMVCNIDKTESINKLFFYYCLCDTNFNSTITGGAQPQITRENLKQVKISLPCLEEQHLIADFLSNFDEAISAAKNELDLWKELKKGLFQQMFV